MNTTITTKKLALLTLLSVAIVGVSAGLFSTESLERDSLLAEPPGAPIEMAPGYAVSKSLANMNVPIPKYLPQGVKFEKAETFANPNSINLVFSNPEKSNTMLFLDRHLTESSILIKYRAVEHNPLLTIDQPLTPTKYEVQEEGKEPRIIYKEQSRPNFVKITVNGIDGILLEQLGITSIGWWNDGTQYTISANLSQDELVTIAESLQ